MITNLSAGNERQFEQRKMQFCRKILFMLRNGPEEIFVRFLNDEILDKLLGVRIPIPSSWSAIQS